MPFLSEKNFSLNGHHFKRHLILTRHPLRGKSSIQDLMRKLTSFRGCLLQLNVFEFDQLQQSHIRFKNDLGNAFPSTKNFFFLQMNHHILPFHNIKA
jgi:hypothetical protein